MEVTREELISIIKIQDFEALEDDQLEDLACDLNITDQDGFDLEIGNFDDNSEDKNSDDVIKSKMSVTMQFDEELQTYREGQKLYFDIPEQPSLKAFFDNCLVKKIKLVQSHETNFNSINIDKELKKPLKSRNEMKNSLS